MTLIRNTDSPTCKLFFNSGTFILTKLSSISLTEIALKIVFVNNIKLQLHSYIAAKDFTPHKLHFRALFFARPRVNGNTKLDYLHNAKILNISGTRGDMTKRKMPFFTFIGLSNKLLFFQ